MLSVASIGEERCHQGDNGGHLSLDFVDARSSSAFIGKNIKAGMFSSKGGNDDNKHTIHLFREGF